jgi:nitroreductase
MQLSDVIKNRRSIRQFKPDEIPPSIVHTILEEARWAPSAGNMQDWAFYVLTGSPLQEFKQANLAKTIEKAAPAPDIPMSLTWPEDLQKRYRDFMESMFAALSVKREDKGGRASVYQSMAQLFGAPCLIVACIPKSIPADYAMFDLGLITQNVCLLACDKGMGTLIMYAAIMYPETLRKIATIPDDVRIIAGIAMGYPVADSPLNNFTRTRLDVNEFVTFIG